jgi:hypothetical protein
LQEKIQKAARHFNTLEPPIRKTPFTKEEIDAIIKEEMEIEFPKERTL